MSGLLKFGGLAHLARCPCAGPIPAAGQAREAHWAWWIAPLHATGLPGAAAPQGARQGSTYAAVGGDSSSSLLPSGGNFPDPLAVPTFSSCATVDGCPPLLPAPPELAATAAAKESLMMLPNTRISAASSLEDSLALVLSPTQLGVQVWESAHAASGLPWWAAIPVCTLAVRGALFPLSLRAYGASANIALLQRAFGLSGAVAEAVAAAKQQAVEQGRGEGEQRAGEGARAGWQGDGEASAHQHDSSNSSRSGGSTGRWQLGRLDLVRRVFHHLRAQQGAPSFGWYVGNVMVQVPLLVSLSLALRRMSDTLWPGFTAEGLMYFQDLTAPPMYLQTLSTPYGTAGAILPLAIVLLYVSAADRSAGGSSPGIHIALKLLALPLYCVALLQPHAVLVYWLAQAATQLGLYELTARLPALRRAAGVPELLVTCSRDGAGNTAGIGEEGQTEDAGILDELLIALSESYIKSGNTAAARICLEAILARQPGHEAAAERLRALKPVSA
ncbi:hypothetical protein Vretifemale_14945 [Volvox reticuliferus]|uniref:Uncharacterized protein n=1 Tax=Volvox reticuliferus TaxID=1737510 RepID=A0A8J4CSH1_9CHLO|nr:hypothetical protein Vretifemale_14945 [Volvox reticuliferus]